MHTSEPVSNSLAPVKIGGLVTHPTPQSVKIAISMKIIPISSPTRKWANIVVTTGLEKTITVMSPTDKCRKDKERSTTELA